MYIPVRPSSGCHSTVILYELRLHSAGQNQTTTAGLQAIFEVGGGVDCPEISCGMGPVPLRKSYAERAERDDGQQLVALARELHHNPNGRPHSLRTVAKRLAERGYVTPSGRHYSASAVSSMLGG
jgi:hypothetical protein